MSDSQPYRTPEDQKPTRPAKIIQIVAAHNNGVYALDDNGNVWWSDLYYRQGGYIHLPWVLVGR